LYCTLGTRHHPSAISPPHKTQEDCSWGEVIGIPALAQEAQAMTGAAHSVSLAVPNSDFKLVKGLKTL